MSNNHKAPPIQWTPEDRARHKAIRELYKHGPGPEELRKSGDLEGPIPMGLYHTVRLIAVELKKAREAQGLSLADIADEYGLEEAALRNIDEGGCTPPVGVLAFYAVAVGKWLNLELTTPPSLKTTVNPNGKLEPAATSGVQA